MFDIFEISNEYEDYLKDESRSIGKADSISFPKNEDEITDIITWAKSLDKKLTVQGARTGITAGAVPDGGHIINLSKMNKIIGLVCNDITTSLYHDKCIDSEEITHNFFQYCLQVQPGVLLSDINKFLDSVWDSNADLHVFTKSWSDESLTALENLRKGEKHFFPPDPTEISASIGGMIACNSSGARSFCYGPTRSYINAISVVLSDGSTIHLKRGIHKAMGKKFEIETSAGRLIKGILPSYKMPEVKNAAGYFTSKNIDLIDLFIGSEGTLGIISEVEILLIPSPACMWGIMSFLPTEKNVLDYVTKLRDMLNTQFIQASPEVKLAAIEFFNQNALNLVRRIKESNPAFSDLPHVKTSYYTAVYTEFHCNNENLLFEYLNKSSELLVQCQGSEEYSWIATDEKELERLRIFRHAIPEAVNLIIDSRRRENKEITKLSTDMSVPDVSLYDVMEMYNTDLEKFRLESVIFGHIGNNHVHVNILPRNIEEYKIAKELYMLWADKIIQLGGSISAEHGIGKLKVDMLKKMYGFEGVEEMRNIKKTFDEGLILNIGNLFET